MIRLILLALLLPWWGILAVLGGIALLLWLGGGRILWLFTLPFKMKGADFLLPYWAGRAYGMIR